MGGEIKCERCGLTYKIDYGVCPRCGDIIANHDTYYYLPCNYSLNRRYIIGKEKPKRCGQYICYKGIDLNNNQSVFIKEFIHPNYHEIERDQFGRIIADTRFQGFVNDQVTYFTQRKSIVDAFNRITQRYSFDYIYEYDYFIENNTVYVIQKIPKGISLIDYIRKKGGKLSYDEAVPILLDVFLYRSICYSNGIFVELTLYLNPSIYIDEYKNVSIISHCCEKLFDPQDESERLEIVPIFFDATAPMELYSKRRPYGLYSEVYICAAIMYKILTGKNVKKVAERVLEEMPYPSELGCYLPEGVEEALIKALSIDYKERQQSIGEFVDDVIPLEVFNKISKCSPNFSESISVSLDVSQLNYLEMKMLERTIATYKVSNLFWDKNSKCPTYRFDICTGTDGIIGLFNDLGKKYPFLKAEAYVELPGSIYHCILYDLPSHGGEYSIILDKGIVMEDYMPYS